MLTLQRHNSSLACFIIFISFSITMNLSSVALGAGNIGIDVELTPVGSFVAKASTVQGNVQQKNTKGLLSYEAKNVILKIDDLKTGVELRDKHMNEKYFESKKFPHAVMVAARGQSGKFKAKLKVHGVDKIVLGTYKVSGRELTATFTTKLSDFKIKPALYMGVGVSDEVKVEVSLPIQ